VLARVCVRSCARSDMLGCCSRLRLLLGPAAISILSYGECIFSSCSAVSVSKLVSKYLKLWSVAFLVLFYSIDLELLLRHVFGASHGEWFHG